jgi:hypothetical protein
VKGKDQSENLGVDGSIISEWLLKERDVNVCTGLMLLRIGISASVSYRYQYQSPPVAPLYHILSHIKVRI